MVVGDWKEHSTSGPLSKNFDSASRKCSHSKFQKYLSSYKNIFHFFEYGLEVRNVQELPNAEVRNTPQKYPHGSLLVWSWFKDQTVVFPNCPTTKVKPSPGGQQTVRIGMFLPHELFSSFYGWRNGVLFYSFFLGSPDDPLLQFKHFDKTVFMDTTEIKACL